MKLLLRIFRELLVSFVTCKNLVEFPVKLADPPVLAVKVVIAGAALGRCTKVDIKISAKKVAHFFTINQG